MDSVLDPGDVVRIVEMESGLDLFPVVVDIGHGHGKLQIDAEWVIGVVSDPANLLADVLGLPAGSAQNTKAPCVGNGGGELGGAAGHHASLQDWEPDSEHIAEGCPEGGFGHGKLLGGGSE